MKLGVNQIIVIMMMGKEYGNVSAAYEYIERRMIRRENSELEEV